MKRFLVLMAAIAVLAMPTGCTPRVRVVANPTPHQKGIRYYRPKPYLLVSSGIAEITVSDKEKTTTTRMVPDPKELLNNKWLLLFIVLDGFRSSIHHEICCGES